MTEIKSHTDLPQSKKLAKILPLKSADMGWNVFVDKSTRVLPIDDWALVKTGSGKAKFYPAWSLTALLDILPNYQLQTQDDGIGILCSYNGKFNIVTASNPVDACVAMIEYLHEKNKVKYGNCKICM